VECETGPHQVDTLGTTTQQWDAQFEGLVSMDLLHPNVVPTLDFCIYHAATEDDITQVWIVQPLCDRGTLSSLLKAGGLNLGGDPSAPPDFKAVLATARDIASALEYIHGMGILHGDLSSNNVLLTTVHNSRGFKAVVNDFGLSRLSKDRDITTKTVGTVSHM